MLLITTAPLWGVACAPGGSGAAPPAPRGREPAVAGGFYPADRARLEAEIDSYLARAKAPLGARPVAIVVPHAGYIYCGQVMAEAWRQAKGHRYGIIVLLGTNHTAPGFERAAVWNGGAWRTPLGSAAVAGEAAAALIAAAPGDCMAYPAAHRDEHSIEVQVPWAQRLFPGVPILPVVIGSENLDVCDRFGRALASVVRDRRPLIVASSDLSHYPAAADARTVDRATLDAMASFDPAAVGRTIAAQESRNIRGLATCACGEAPILAAMVAARALGATRGAVVAYANSGDVPGGDTRRVVGYGAVAFTAEGKSDRAGAPEKRAGAPEKRAEETERAAGKPAAGTLSASERKTLLARARDTIRNHFETGALPPKDGCGASLLVHRGAFVTLKKGGELRGCIGHTNDDMALCDVVSAMAIEAAFGDPRFPPLRRDELERCHIEISVLTPFRRVSNLSEIVVGRDGVLLRKEGRSAVFLPQVATEQGWTRETMLSELARKAGLPADAWKSGAELHTFQAEVFAEAQPR